MPPKNTGVGSMISIIVPIYKVESYLHQCVNSILNQTYRDLEVLLIDDGSPDCCGEICDEYGKKDQRVRVFHTENRGLSAARNLGLKEAQGEYIGFVDSDDWVEPIMYEVLLGRLEETGADICVCGLWYEYDGFKKKMELEEAIYSNDDALRLLLDEKISNHAWNKLYRREVFLSVAFPERMLFEDIVVMHRFLEVSNTIVTTKVCGYHYRQRLDGICSTHTAKNLIDYTDAHLSRYNYLKENDFALFKEKEDVLLKYIAEAISRLMRWWNECSTIEKQLYSKKLSDYREFARTSIPLLGNGTWLTSTRLSIVFMRNLNVRTANVYCWISQLRRLFRYDNLKYYC